ncbi:MAG: hypothetical protein ACP5NC_06655, partial [Nitrososphaeria archaeon]
GASDSCKASLDVKGIRLKKLYGDGAYDTNEMFNAIGDAESAIKISKNALTCHCREAGNKEVRQWATKNGQKRLGMA